MIPTDYPLEEEQHSVRHRRRNLMRNDAVLKNQQHLNPL